MKILFLTNPYNDEPKEDDYLSQSLSNDFKVITSHPLECEHLLSSVDGILIRNVWPTHEFTSGWWRIMKAISNSGVSTYNPLTGRGDIQGKDYLVDLYKSGFRVVPSVNNIKDIEALPESEAYWVKPKEGADGYGAKKLSKYKLFHESLNNLIIQPFIDFVSEPSFYFIDNIFSYAITTTNRLKDENVVWYEPTKRI